MKNFTSSDNVPMYHALEEEGTVYASIPAKGLGRGRVRVVIETRTRGRDDRWVLEPQCVE